MKSILRPLTPPASLTPGADWLSAARARAGESDQTPRLLDHHPAAEARDGLDQMARIDRLRQVQMEPGLEGVLAILLARE